MPKSAFSALEHSVQTFLGGAKVSLAELQKDEPVPESEDLREIIIRLEIDGVIYLFRARRKELAFTATEKSFIKELLAAPCTEFAPVWATERDPANPVSVGHRGTGQRSRDNEVGGRRNAYYMVPAAWGCPPIDRCRPCGIPAHDDPGGRPRGLGTRSRPGR